MIEETELFLLAHLMHRVAPHEASPGIYSLMRELEMDHSLTYPQRFAHMLNALKDGVDNGNWPTKETSHV